MFHFLSKSFSLISAKMLIFSLIILIGVPIVDLIDWDDQYFHNAFWFFYLIPCVIVTVKKGKKHGVIVTAAEAILFLAIESSSPEGLESEDIINVLIIVILNTLISLTVGMLVNENQHNVSNLKESEERFKTLFENLLAGFYLIQNHKPIFVNQWFADFLGVPREELINGGAFLKYIMAEDMSRLRMNFQRLIEGKESFFSDEIQVVTRGGAIKNMEVQAAATTIQGVPAIAGLAMDVTDRKQAKADLEHMAYHDALTGLPNMNYLHHYLIKEFNTAKRTGAPSCIMFFNLDQFKFINDFFGHRLGDQLLRLVAHRLKKTINSVGTVVRAGGDDFIIYYPHTSQNQAKDFAELVLDAFSKPFQFDGQEIRISASIGISISEQGEFLEEMLKKASVALHFAKERGRNQYRFYSVEFYETLNRKMLLEQELRKVLEQEGLEVHYQPKLDLNTNRISGMEALARWTAPEFGPVSPEEFIPIAEETGLIVPLGKWVLETACKQTLDWQRQGHGHYHVCVNISSRQFLQDDFVPMIEQVLQQCGLAPEYLNLEITEGIALYNVEDAIKKLKELKEYGISISLDDFGKGYSSLSYIKLLPIDFLKIDRAFINDITRNTQDAALIDSIISLAHTFDFRVVAEGVEDRQQLDMLTTKACDEIQGFYFAKPMSADQFERFLEKRNEAFV